VQSDANYAAPAGTVGDVKSSDPAYATAAAGAALTASGQQTLIVGQSVVSGNYHCTETFLRFNTGAVLPDACTVTNVTLHTWLVGPAAAIFPAERRAPRVGIDTALEARSKAWGPTLATTDWVAGSTLGTLPLRATVTVGTTTPTNGWLPWTSDASFKTVVSKTGYTELVLHSVRHRTATAPTDGVDEEVEISVGATPTGYPYLEITYTVP
jgi:hypothetical protein